MLCLITMSANAAMPYRVRQVVTPADEIPAGNDDEAFARVHRFYVGGMYNFSMWQSYTDENDVRADGKNTSSFDVVAGLRIYDTFRLESNYTRTNANLYVPEGTIDKYKAAKGWMVFAGMYEGELQEAEVDGFKYAYLPNSREATLIAGDYSEMRDITIPGTVVIEDETYQVKEIGNGAFRDRYLNKVIISDGVEIIGKNVSNSLHH